jgi:chromosome segregation ATPase
MNKKARTSVIFVILLLLLSLGASGFYYISFEREKQISKELEVQLDIVNQEKNKIETQLRQIDSEKASLDSKLKENLSAISKLNDKLTQEIKARELLKSEQESLRNKIIEISQEKQNMQQSLGEKAKEIDSLKSKLSFALSEKEELKKKVQEQPVVKQEAVNLEKIVVAPANSKQEKIETAPAQKELKRKPLVGEVLLINKEYGFLVLNIGQIDEVAAEDVFDIIHGNLSLGRVKVEKVHERMSAANFQPGFNTNKVSEGDAANRID